MSARTKIELPEDYKLESDQCVVLWSGAKQPENYFVGNAPPNLNRNTGLDPTQLQQENIRSKFTYRFNSFLDPTKEIGARTIWYQPSSQLLFQLAQDGRDFKWVPLEESAVFSTPKLVLNENGELLGEIVTVREAVDKNCKILLSYTEFVMSTELRPDKKKVSYVEILKHAKSIISAPKKKKKA